MNTATALFRVDASIQIGTGHAMRCLALALELRAQGVECIFASRAHPGHASARIQAEGFEVKLLPAQSTPSLGGPSDSPAHASWLGTSWEDDARETIAWIGAVKPDWIVVDHYALDHRWEAALMSHCGSLAVLDDLADRRHECDLLVDQNPGRERGDYLGLVPPRAIVLVGSKFAALRPEFLRERRTSLLRRNPAPLRQVLVGMGGMDGSGATSKVLHALTNCRQPEDFSVSVMMGGSSPHLAVVQAMAGSLPFTCVVQVDALNVAELMARSDIAIGAGGVSALERCCMGLPSILVILADNQRAGGRALLRQKAVSLIPAPELIPGQLPELFEQARSPAWLATTSLAAQQVTDGRGAMRIVAQMLDRVIPRSADSLRPMTTEDLDLVLEWRNHPDISRFMRRSSPIGQAEHERWFNSAAAEQGRHLLIFLAGGNPRGFVNIGPIQDDVAEWGFYAAPGAPSGTGRRLGEAALDFAFRTLGLRKVYGQAFEFNEASRRFHLSLGFRRTNGTVGSVESEDPSTSLQRFELLSEQWASERDDVENDR